MSDFQHEMAQALRASHCDRPNAIHECVGEVTIKRGEVCFACKLCGSGCERPGWDERDARRLKAVLAVAGLEWDALSVHAQVAAIRALKDTEPKR